MWSDNRDCIVLLIEGVIDFLEVADLACCIQQTTVLQTMIFLMAQNIFISV